MDECVEALETSSIALPSDKLFCKHIRLQHATDEHSRRVFASHLFRPSATSKPDTYEILESFKNRLANWDDKLVGDTGNGKDPNLYPSILSLITAIIGLGAIRLFYHSSTLYVYEAVAAIDGGVDGFQPDRARGAAPSSKFSPVSECVEAAHEIISIFTSLDLRDIRGMPTIFLIRVVHAMIFLVKSIGANGSKGVGQDDAKIEHQLDDMIEVMATWGSDWPACRLIQILIRLRRQLRDNKSNTPIASASSSRNSCPPQEGQETESSTPTFPDLPTPSPYQHLAPQSFEFKPEDFAAPDDTLYGDPNFWDTFLEQVPQPNKPMSPDYGNHFLWKALQPQAQQNPFSSEDAFGNGCPPAMDMFSSDNSKQEVSSHIAKLTDRTTGNSSNLNDFTNQLLPVSDMDTNMNFFDNMATPPQT